MRCVIQKAISPEKFPPAMIERGVELSGLPANKVERMIKDIWKVEGIENYDTFLLFRYAERNGYYRHTAKKFKDIAAFRCLVLLDEVQAEAILRDTAPPGNVIHGLERLLTRSMLLEYQYIVYLVQYLLGCSMKSAMAYAPNCDSVLTIIDTARRNGYIDNLAADIALHSFCFLLDPMEISRIVRQEKIKSDDFESLANLIKSKGLGSANMARIRRWQPIPRDEIQEAFDHGRDSTEKEARDEIYIRRLMRKHRVDRMDAFTAFHDTRGSMDQADQACAKIAQHNQERLAQRLPTVPTRDTRSPPNVTPRTRILAVLGLHEEDAESISACPSIGDGWMVSDFYLWMHVLHGMGRSQEWITSLEPQYLVEKYGQRRQSKSGTGRYGT